MNTEHHHPPDINHSSSSVDGAGSVITVIKIGGNVIDNSKTFHQFLKDFSELKGLKILVHGGGKAATKLSDELGVEAKVIDGRRITDIESLRIVTMVYAGLISKNIVAQLQAAGCNAIGLSGPDGNLITARKRPIQKVLSLGEDLGEATPFGGDLEGAVSFEEDLSETIRSGENSNETMDYGFVGDLHSSSVNLKSLTGLLDQGFIPVFSAITHDGNGQLLNTNADTVASAIAVALAAEYDTSLVYCFEKKGVLQDVEDEDSVIREMNFGDFNSLKEQQLIAGGMLPKLLNAFEAIKNGVKEVYIGKADDLNYLDQQTFGTRLVQ